MLEKSPHKRLHCLHLHEFNTFRSNPDQIPGRWCIIHTSLSTSTPDTWLTLLLWKRAHILAKSAIFCKAVVMSTHFRGPTSMLIFWNYITLYFRASFHHFSNILTSFRRGDFIPTRKRTTEILTQIRQSFCKRRSKSFIEKLSDFTFAADFGHKKELFIRDFLFSKPVNLGTSVRKTNRRSRKKQRPKKIQQKYHCSTSRKVLYEAFGLCLKLAFLKHKSTVSSISTSLNVK